MDSFIEFVRETETMAEMDNAASDRFTEPRFDLQDELPPVKPPSAGFIVQLFVIPALIVAVVVGIWALFGKMAAGEQDWRELVEEIRNTNEHRRWRAANGLASLLNSDQRLGENGQHLATNPDIALALSELLREGLRSRSQREDDVNQQSFLALTLALSDVTTTTFPVLQEAMQPEQDREVRKNAIAAVAVASGRLAERGKPVTDAALAQSLIAASRDEDALLRQSGAFALGLVKVPDCIERLTVMISDADANTRVNAAVGLARQESTAGLPVFREVFQDAVGSKGPHAGDPDLQERLLAVKNGLAAVSKISDKLNADEKVEFAKLIAPIAAEHTEPRLRTDANEALLKLKSSSR